MRKACNESLTNIVAKVVLSTLSRRRYDAFFDEQARVKAKTEAARAKTKAKAEARDREMVLRRTET